MIRSKQFKLFFAFSVLFAANGLAEQKIDSLKTVLGTARDAKKRSELFLQLGDAETAVGRYDSALTWLLKAAALIDSLQAKGEKVSNSKTYKSINNVYLFAGNYAKALDYGYKALAIDESAKDSAGISKSSNNIGSAYAYLGNRDSSLKYFIRSLNIKRRIHAKPGSIISSCINIANINIGRDSYDTAFRYLNEALALALKDKDEISAAKVYPSMGIAYYKQKQYDLAIKNYSLSQEIALRTPGLKHLVVSNYAGLSDAFIKKGNYALAYETLKKASDLKDSLTSAEINKQMTDMNTKYESEKKDKEIIILNKDKKIKDAEIERQKAETDRQNTQRNAFIAGFLLVLVLGGFVLYGYRQQQKANVIITAQKREVEHQKHLVEEKQKEILDSIRYAQRIQNNILPTRKYIDKNLKRLTES